ncbi:MAG TPA: heme-dependent oxidative N-demethylase subunit alpha family protein [Verrucomicrobiae bacterium]|nr:heme-dependent oxidative N-demethylase subunit alpha family protein [Verrucomicrobiae bacterium]
MNLPSLRELFPDNDFGFSMRMRPGRPVDFFAQSPEGEAILAERARWLDTDPARYLASAGLPETLAHSLRRFAEAETQLSLDATGQSEDAAGLLEQLGRRWEPDFLLLSPTDSGTFVLRAGCVCFPSGWALEEKLGRPLDEIHGVVPGLNAAIGAKIHQFLARLKPDAGWFRSNWGLSSSPENNQHPARAVNQLSAATPPESVWLRVEHQVLTGLAGGGVLFGIRLENVPLTEIHSDDSLSRGLHRALATMPGEMARYKNLTAIMPALLDYLA